MTGPTRIALHESGHAVAALALGVGVRLATIRAVPAAQGCVWHASPFSKRAREQFLTMRAAPLPLVPPTVRRGVEKALLILFSGDLAATLLAAPMASYRGQTPDDVDVDLAIAALSRSARATLAEHAAESPGQGPTDGDRAARIATIVVGDPAWLYAELFRAQAAEVVLAHRAEIVAVACELDRVGVLSGRRVAEIAAAARSV